MKRNCIVLCTGPCIGFIMYYYEVLQLMEPFTKPLDYVLHLFNPYNAIILLKFRLQRICCANTIPQLTLLQPHSQSSHNSNFRLLF